MKLTQIAVELVPPNPKELTVARLGWPAGTEGQAMALVGT